MKLSPGLSRLSGVILSGMLLIGGNTLLPSTSQVSAGDPQIVPIAFNLKSTSPLVPQFIHQELPLNTTEVNLKTLTSNERLKTAQTEQVQTANNQEASKLTQTVQAVQIAQVTPNESPVDTHISRGSSDFNVLIDHAVSLVGRPYIFGGTSLNGFDCSGFTQYVYAGSGISLPRTSYAQYSSGNAVSKDKLQPGDLVFFSTYSNGASHVGIYIGGGRFVHADNPRKGVTITSLSDSFYTEHYLGARRYS
ncbi:cell wall-associated hydrolase, invasion-associated protein [Desulfosporosinus acidiphilus SJ4]|uniref:Cell wall-associated hydrolase, invasion-associated protein n=1 Tax=Desulfosporosinus acidiphilus (strain DSM 22704 / JCM 16185 / SJ4) TaxID=646529 RepID=I4D7J1_DESAJ|nr:C40 family peptidase [Desulfosporosinus acidiphilus]AFM41765.1 cell wall-associated hydrolase, invasion-associated protein [Desulfosporosinus acidiphilus SJ4]